MKLIMENWRKFTEQVDKETQFFGRDYDKNPLTDEEIALLAQDDDDGLNARAQLIAHIYDYQELPDMSPTMQLKSKKSDPEKQEVSDRAFEMLAQTAEKHGQEISDTGVDRTQGQEKAREEHGYVPYNYPGEKGKYGDCVDRSVDPMTGQERQLSAAGESGDGIRRDCSVEEMNRQCWINVLANALTNTEDRRISFLTVVLENTTAHSYKIQAIDPGNNSRTEINELFFDVLQSLGITLERRGNKTGLIRRWQVAASDEEVARGVGRQQESFCPIPTHLINSKRISSLRPGEQISFMVPLIGQAGDPYDIALTPTGLNATHLTSTTPLRISLNPGNQPDYSKGSGENFAIFVAEYSISPDVLALDGADNMTREEMVAASQNIRTPVRIIGLDNERNEYIRDSGPEGVKGLLSKVMFPRAYGP